MSVGLYNTDILCSANFRVPAVLQVTGNHGVYISEVTVLVVFSPASPNEAAERERERD